MISNISLWYDGIKLNSKIEPLSLMYWIPKMNKNPVASRFVIVSLKYTKTPFKRYHSEV